MYIYSHIIAREINVAMGTCMYTNIYIIMVLEAHFTDFKSLFYFSDRFELNGSMIKIWHLQFHILVI